MPVRRTISYSFVTFSSLYNYRWMKLFDESGGYDVGKRGKRLITQRPVLETLRRRNLGPVPGGDYKIDLSLDFLRKAPVSKGITTESHGVELLPWGNGYLYSGWGQWRARLEALPGTDLRGRDGLFYLHDSYKGYTHGCVETNTALYYDLFKYRKTQKSIKVRIAYPGPNSSTLGNTQQFPPPWWDGSEIEYYDDVPMPRAASGNFPDPKKL